jgi:hypothetical protein
MNAPPALKRRVFWFILLTALGGLSAWGWVQRGELLAWHWARGLANAEPDDCGWYVDRLASLDGDAVDALVNRLRTGDNTCKTNCGWALSELARRWGATGTGSQHLAERLASAYGSLDLDARREALTALHALLVASEKDAAPDWLHHEFTQLLSRACKDVEAETLPMTLTLAAQFLHQAGSARADWMASLEPLVDAGLTDERAECRVGAIRLAAAPQVALLEKVTPILHGLASEPAAEVRITALLVLGGHEELLPTDELLPFLHDSNAEVRGVCEQALRSRGLLAGHVQLARQMADPQPVVRARVPALVHEFPDLDAQLWLDKLSRDQSPAVRAAVLRAAGESKEWRLADRMREMSKSDPSPTIRQIARHYLHAQLRDE